MNEKLQDVGFVVGDGILRSLGESDAFEEEKGVETSPPVLGTAVAFAAGGLVVATATAANRGGSPLHSIRPWRIAFAVTSLPSLLIGLLCLTFREPIEASSTRNQSAKQGAVRFVIDHSGLLIPMLVGFGQLLICGQSLISWVPSYV